MQITISVEDCMSESAMSYNLYIEKSDGTLETTGSKQETGEFELPLGPKASTSSGNVFVATVSKCSDSIQIGMVY